MPVAAFAYLDPGTGAVLINLLIAGVATAIFFFFRGIFFRLIGKKSPEKKITKTDAGVVIFNEGKQYWSTFEPIVRQLIELGKEFRYYTLDVSDPALLIENELMQSKFLGYGNLAKAKVGRIKADILLSTTPNIGTPGYPVQRSPHVHKLVHVLHSLNDISWYKTGSLDHYDMVILGGDYQAEAIVELEKIRKLKPKELVTIGLPYLDHLVENRITTRNQVDNDETTILVGASWGSKGLLSYYGSEFILNLARAGYKVIVRPHPQSFQSELKLMETIEKEISVEENIIWDRAISPSESLAVADLLISDTSALRFDFAFVYEKPVITLDIPQEYVPGFERDDLKKSWMDDAAKKIGCVLEENQLPDIVKLVEELLKQNYSEKIRNYRDDTVSNFGGAGAPIANYLMKFHQEVNKK